MKNIKIVYQYDGSCFYGMQRQKDKKTVQGVIENILENAFKEKVNLVSSGRTDRGVHAKMQISNFIMEKNIPLDIIKYKLNKYAEGEIKVLDIEEVELGYSSRYSSSYRTYEYILKREDLVSPFEKNYVTSIGFDVDIERLNDILKMFIGQHNFVNFSRKEKDKVINYNREVYEFYATKKDENIYIYVSANSFLKSMVRIMVGTALEIYKGKIDESYILDGFKEEYADRKKYVLDGSGLYLFLVK